MVTSFGEQMADRGPFCFLVAPVPGQSHQRRQDHWERAAANQQSGDHSLKDGGQRLAAKQYLSGSAVPTSPLLHGQRSGSALVAGDARLAFFGAVGRELRNVGSILCRRCTCYQKRKNPRIAPECRLLIAPPVLRLEADSDSEANGPRSDASAQLVRRD
jgi:hypothetical protein